MNPKCGGSNAREGAKATSLAFVSMRVSEEERSVRDGVYSHVVVQRGKHPTRTMYSTETHTSDFILNTF